MSEQNADLWTRDPFSIFRRWQTQPENGIDAELSSACAYQQVEERMAAIRSTVRSLEKHLAERQQALDLASLELVEAEEYHRRAQSRLEALVHAEGAATTDAVRVSRRAERLVRQAGSEVSAAQAARNAAARNVCREERQIEWLRKQLAGLEAAPDQQAPLLVLTLDVRR